MEITSIAHDLDFLGQIFGFSALRMLTVQCHENGEAKYGMKVFAEKLGFNVANHGHFPKEGFPILILNVASPKSEGLDGFAWVTRRRM